MLLLDGLMGLEHVEVLAIIRGIIYAKKLHLPTFILELDCLSAVRTINAKKDDMSASRNVIFLTKEGLRDIESLGLLFVKQIRNVPTHLLANFSISIIEPFY